MSFKQTILIVDDDESVLDGLRRAFHRIEGIRVLTCSEPYVALDMALSEPVDLFLCDYQMPSLNGVEFLVFAREARPDAIRFLISGGDSFDGLANAINRAKIHRFIAKPIDANELIFLVEQALQEVTSAQTMCQAG